MAENRFGCASVTDSNYRGVHAATDRNTGPLVKLGATAANISGGPVFYGSVGYGIISRGDAGGKTCEDGNAIIYAPLDQYAAPILAG